MKRIFGFLTAAAFAGMLFAANALAASSGNFSAVAEDAQCTINSGSGVLVGGAGGGPSSTAGTVFEIGSEGLTVNIANGSGTTLVVTPSLVTGLFTDNKITSSTSSSTQNVGIQIQVNVTPVNGTVVAPGAIKIAPMTTGTTSVCVGGSDAGGTCATPANQATCTGGGGACTGDLGATCSPEGVGVNGVASCVIYDQRFIQVSSTVLSQLSGCSALSGGTCFELIESTLSAHAFNFYVQAPGGSYNFDVDAQLFVGANNTSGAGSIAGCSGPGTVTVVQVKNYSFNSTLTF